MLVKVGNRDSLLRVLFVVFDVVLSIAEVASITGWASAGLYQGQDHLKLEDLLHQ